MTDEGPKTGLFFPLFQTKIYQQPEPVGIKVLRAVLNSFLKMLCNTALNPLTPLCRFFDTAISNECYSTKIKDFQPIFFQEPASGIYRSDPHIIFDVMSCHHVSMSFLPSAVSPKMSKIVTKT